MTQPFASRITGTGSAFPKRRVTNDDLAKELARRGQETSNDWIVERTGIHERRISEPDNPQETNSSLALAASLRALEMAGKRPEDIDQILYATCSPDTPIPSSSCWLQEKLGAKNAWALDVNAACSGFIYALSIADQFISNGRSKCSLIIGAEVLSSITNWDDRTSCILFGDAAGAVIVEPTSPQNPHRLYSTHLHSDGSLADLFHVPGGGSKQPLTPDLLATHANKMTMKGKEIFKVATKTLSEFALKALEPTGLSPEELHWLIPHQANLRIIEAVAKRLGFPMERVIVNIDRYGNTSAATVPTALDEAVRSGKIKSGDWVCLDVFGAGLTYGSALLKW